MASVFVELAEKVAEYIGQHDNIDADVVSVHPTRTLKAEQKEYIAVLIGADAPISPEGILNQGFIDWTVEIIVENAVRFGGGNVESLAAFKKIQETREMVHEQIMKELRGDLEGRGFIFKVVPLGGTQSEALETDATSVVVTGASTWEFWIRTTLNSLEA